MTDAPVPRPMTGLALLMLGSGVLIAVGSSILNAVFAWPARLDDHAATALPAFAEHATAIRAGFYLNMLSSLIMISVPIVLADRFGWTGGVTRSLTAFGVLGALAQMLGWIRWPLVVPGLAHDYLAAAPDSAERAGAGAAYDLINAYAGGALGEHLGWLLQGVWAVGVGVLLLRSRFVPRWLTIPGVALAVVWLPATTFGGFSGSHTSPVATIGSLTYTVWSVWLVVTIAVLAVRQVRERRTVA